MEWSQLYQVHIFLKRGFNNGRRKNTVLFPYETLKKLSMDAFQKIRFLRKEADIIQDVLLTSDLFGIQSHGMQRMVRYHKGITNGLIKIDAKPEIVKETPISAVIDGHDGMGQLLGHKAMEMAIEKLKIRCWYRIRT